MSLVLHITFGALFKSKQLLLILIDQVQCLDTVIGACLKTDRIRSRSNRLIQISELGNNFQFNVGAW